MMESVIRLENFYFAYNKLFYIILELIFFWI